MGVLKKIATGTAGAILALSVMLGPMKGKRRKRQKRRATMRKILKKARRQSAD